MNCQTIESKYKKIEEISFNGNQNFVFGCGWMGQNFVTPAKQMGIKIDGFVVSQKKQNTVQGLPVYDLSELKKITGKKNIFVALRDQDTNLNKRLSELCDVVYPVTYPEHISVIAAQYYLNYFRNMKIDLSGDTVELKGFRFINPFIQPYDYLLSWVYEAGDLVLPELWDNYDRIDEGPYEVDNVRLEKDDIVFDCGANIGIFSAIARQKGCKVYAFEPMPAAIKYLQELQLFLKEGLQICPYALSDRSGEADFHVQNFDLLGASLLKNNNIIDQDYVVKMISIDEFVRTNGIKKVDFIKADIEGSERDMIWGAREVIKKYAPKLSICTYHLADDKQILEGRIKEINPNYVIEHRWKKLFAYVPKN